ncbi:hypothetical protein ACJRO7_011677 [Eucalyptus globulus]|uniref:Malectin-like domain-containing protein n=1 Tax=Eucalyptus globulus TaxID=34317 RepID=A0ABD3LG21_EUCGL
MEIGVLFFLVFFSPSQDTLAPLQIDCRTETSYDTGDGILWHTDLDFIKTCALRFFPGTKQEYSLPAVAQKRYFVRTAFYYGNYDGLLRPPSFGLEFNGNKYVCYCSMGQVRAGTTSYHYNYGTTELILGYPQDKYNRKWQPMIPQGTEDIHASFISVNRLTAEYPPNSAFLDTIEALDHLQIQSVVLWGTYIMTLSPWYQSCTDLEINIESIGVSDKDICVQLLPTVNTTLPCIISAIKFSASIHPLVTTRTSHDDLEGLQTSVKTYEQLQGWSSDACLPSDTTWSWISCQGDLGNKSLNRPIPEFLGKLPNLKDKCDPSNNPDDEESRNSATKNCGEVASLLA